RFAEVAEDLRRQGVLRHPLPLVVWARLTRQDRAVHWGEYLITTPLSPLGLLARVTGLPDPVHQLTVPEGLTVRQVVQLLAASGFGAEESFLCLLEDPRFLASEDMPPAGAEGYLFPDTYQFPLATPQERILRAMVRRFREVFGPPLGRRAAAHGLTEEQAVTLASLVEEETARPEERRLVAAVLLNRLHRGLPLPSDPTVLYGRRRPLPTSPLTPPRDPGSGRDGQRACGPVQRADGVPRPAKAGAAYYPEHERVTVRRRVRSATHTGCPRVFQFCRAGFCRPRHPVRTIHRTAHARFPIPTRPEKWSRVGYPPARSCCSTADALLR